MCFKYKINKNKIDIYTYRYTVSLFQTEGPYGVHINTVYGASASTLATQAQRHSTPNCVNSTNGK